jgi:DNA polymerase-3 subunit epsilon
MPDEARAIHGLDDDFLADKPLFAQVADAFLEFIGEDPLVIHNAKFDIAFLNAELERLEKPLITLDRAVDTVLLARRRFPGAQASLDALCKRFEIDNSARSFHGALLDCELLAEVYLELRGGRQPGFELKTEKSAFNLAQAVRREPRAPRPHAASEAELKRHEAMVAELTDPVWKA